MEDGVAGMKSERTSDETLARRAVAANTLAVVALSAGWIALAALQPTDLGGSLLPTIVLLAVLPCLPFGYYTFRFMVRYGPTWSLWEHQNWWQRGLELVVALAAAAYGVLGHLYTWVAWSLVFVQVCYVGISVLSALIAKQRTKEDQPAEL